MSAVQPNATPAYLKLRLSFNKVCEIFEVHPKTLRRWMREGVPLPDGGRIAIHAIPLGARRTVFEKEEVDRVYQALRAAGQEMAEVIPITGEDEEALCQRCRCHRHHVGDRRAS